MSFPEMNVPMNYVEPPTVPEGMTLREYRRQRPAPRTRRRGLLARRRTRARARR